MALYSTDEPCDHRYLMAYKLMAYPVSVGSGSTAWLRPERRLCSDSHLLQAQVPGGRGLTWAAGDRRDRQAAEEEVHGGEKGLQKTDGAESGASMGGKVDFIGVRAGRLEERFILTGRYSLLAHSYSLAAFRRLALEGVGFVGTRSRGAKLQKRRIQRKRRERRRHGGTRRLTVHRLWLSHGTGRL